MGHLLDPILLGLMAQLVGLVWLSRIVIRRERRWRVALGAGWAGFVALWLTSSPWVASLLVGSLQVEPPDLSAELRETPEASRALVVLSAGWRNEYSYVPSSERLGGDAQGRLIGAARIYRAHGFGTVIVTGQSQAYVGAMADLLVDLGVPRERIQLESASEDTEDNAANSARILEKVGARKVVLVTSATHLRRSLAHFKAAGVDALGYPVAYVRGDSLKLLPSARAALMTHQALHEFLGLLET